MRPVCFVLLGCALAGCSFDLPRVRAELSPRASKELSCPDAKLTFKEVKVPLSASNVLVTGCGQSGEYVMEEGRWRPVRRGSR
jgi:hypothetical protein